MQAISVRTTQNVFIDYPLASIGDRILGYLLDALLLIVYGAMIIVLGVSAEIDIWQFYVIMLVVPMFFYHLAFEVFMNGQSPGKRLMKIQVVRLDGTQPTVGDYLLRWIFRLVDFHILSGAIAVVIIAAGGKGQRLGDVVAGTAVVKLIEQQQITSKEVFITPEASYQPTYPQVTQLEPRDIELIQRAIDAHNAYGNEQPVMVVAEKIKSLLGIQTELSPVAFLVTIVKDYNHLTSL